MPRQISIITLGGTWLRALLAAGKGRPGTPGRLPGTGPGQVMHLWRLERLHRAHAGLKMP
jgi:hypothetical protein